MDCIIYKRENFNIMDSFTATISKSFADLSETFATQVAEDVIRRLSLKFGFDVQAAREVIFAKGVKIESATTEILKKDLPWCGVVDEDCCHAISFGNRLFRQCHKPQKKGVHCTQCANQLAKDGTLKYGDVNARMTCGVMDYESGKDKVVSYAGYMARNNLTEADVLAAAQTYGLTIDPLQFIAMPKRGRPAKKAMVVAEETDSSESEEEQVPILAFSAMTQPENAAEVVAEVVAEVAEVGAAEEEEEEEEEMTMERLNSLDRSELNALAKEHGVTGSTKAKKIEGIAMKLKIGDYEESGGDRDGI
jgi:hypothetical protein